MRNDCLRAFLKNQDRTNRRLQSRSTLRLLSIDPNVREMRSERFVYTQINLVPEIWIRLYDHLGKVVEESLIESNGALVFRWIYFYDEQGRKVLANLHNSEGRLLL